MRLLNRFGYLVNLFIVKLPNVVVDPEALTVTPLARSQPTLLVADQLTSRVVLLQ